MARSNFSYLPGALLHHLSLSSLIRSLFTDSCPLTFKNAPISHPPQTNTKNYTLILISLNILFHLGDIYSCLFYILLLIIHSFLRLSK